VPPCFHAERSVSDREVLRRRMRAYRRTLSARERAEAAEAVASHLLELPGLDAADAVAGYFAVDGELPLSAVATRLITLGKRYYLPVLEPGERLSFRRFETATPLVPNRFGIPEPSSGESLAPESLDLVLLPLVAFDARGNRLGSGAGYYDRTFAFRRHAEVERPLLVGVGYAFQQRPLLPAADWDIPLDFVLTDRGLIDCRTARLAETAR
jgi:5-formyltetrahydrofolate cyclo-ligase